MLCRIFQASILLLAARKATFRANDTANDLENLDQDHANYHAIVSRAAAPSCVLASTEREQKLDDLLRFKIWRIAHAESEAKKSTVSQFAQKLMSTIPENLRLPENAALTEVFVRSLTVYLNKGLLEHTRSTTMLLSNGKNALDRYEIVRMSRNLPEASFKSEIPRSASPKPRHSPVSRRSPSFQRKKSRKSLIVAQPDAVSLNHLLLLLPKAHILEKLTVSGAAPDKIDS